MMRVSSYEQSVETFSTFSTAFESESEINQSELDVHSSVWSDSFWSDITKWTLWCCVLCFYIVLFGGFGGILESKQQKATIQCKTREKMHQSKCCSNFFFFVDGNVDRLVHHFGSDLMI